MKKIVLIICLLLSACGKEYVPVQGPKIPSLPPALAQKAKPLPPIKDNTMGGLVTTVAQDSQQYNAIAWQLNAVLDIYNCVRDAVNNNTDVKKCLN